MLPKCGTSALYNYLALSDNAVSLSRKELCYDNRKRDIVTDFFNELVKPSSNGTIADGELFNGKKYLQPEIMDKQLGKDLHFIGGCIHPQANQLMENLLHVADSKNLVGRYMPSVIIAAI